MCKQLGGKTLQQAGSHEVGLFFKQLFNLFDTDTMFAIKFW